MKRLSVAKSQKAQTAAIIAAVSVGASVAVTLIGIACLASFYGKTLHDVEYMAEHDIYEE